MFKLQICGFPELNEVIDSFQPTHIISAINWVEPLPGRHLHVDVSDVSRPMDGHVHPKSEHLKQVLAFTIGLTDADRLLVHCYAGQSRSTAFAIAVLIQHGLSYEAAFDQVAAIRSILLPNRLIIQLTDDHFALNGNLTRLIADYEAAHQARLRSEHSHALSARDRPPTRAEVDWMKMLISSLRSA
jgi:predicted protein tyrosine phosphatase